MRVDAGWGCLSIMTSLEDDLIVVGLKLISNKRKEKG
jgi:hypothetical protein